MKRAAGPSRSSKSDAIIVHDDADEPPVKREAEEEPAPSPEVAELRLQLKQKDERFEKLCDVARRDQETLKEKVEWLEAAIESKNDIRNSANNASVDNALKKKVVELEKQLNEERQISAEQKKKFDLELLHQLQQLVQLVQQPTMSGPNLAAATFSLGSQSHAPEAAPLVNQPQLQPTVQSRNDWEIACICGQKEDDGEKKVLCDQCKYRWEHIDCIFPKTKQVPPGKYLCHTCYPRPTELTGEQARAYQDRVQARKDEENNLELKRKLAERAKKREENSRKLNSRKLSSSNIGSTRAAFREIQENEYSNDAKSFIDASRASVDSPADAEILQILRDSPGVRTARVRSVVVEEKTQGLFTAQNIPQGSYIAELCGYVSLQSENANRDILPGFWVNDCTFLIKKDGGKLLIDARKMGNVARYVRRSCKPNAELNVIMSASDLRVMIKLKEKVELRKMQEVSIAFEDDWKEHPRPAQGCTCRDKELKTCEIELFFNKASQGVNKKSRLGQASKGV